MLQSISIVIQYILNNANKAELRNKYSEVKLVIIDELSMVSSKSFYQMHKRLNEIFSPGQDVPFGGKFVLVCGGLCQLPPVRAKPVYTFNDTKTMEGFISIDAWRKLRLAEPDQVMRQDDEMFVNMLNKTSVGEIDQNVEDVIKLRFIDKNDHVIQVTVCIFLKKMPQLKDTMTIN